MIILFVLIFILLLYLFCISPRIYNKPNLHSLKNRLYAHRGLHDNNSDCPENSIASFQKAVEFDYGVEFDVQLTKDEKLVVFHDESLKRMCGVDAKVSDYTFSNLQKFNLLNSNEKIPTFKEVLTVVNNRIPLIIEIKMHDTSTRVCEVLQKELENYKGAYCVESFNPLAVLWFKKKEPDIIRGQLSEKFDKTPNIKLNIMYFFTEYLLTNVFTRPDFIAYNHKHHKNISRMLCRNFFGSLSVAWTIKNKKEFDEAKNNFDLIIFEGFIAKI